MRVSSRVKGSLSKPRWPVTFACTREADFSELSGHGPNRRTRCSWSALTSSTSAVNSCMSLVTLRPSSPTTLCTSGGGTVRGRLFRPVLVGSAFFAFYHVYKLSVPAGFRRARRLEAQKKRTSSAAKRRQRTWRAPHSASNHKKSQMQGTVQNSTMVPLKTPLIFVQWWTRLQLFSAGGGGGDLLQFSGSGCPDAACTGIGSVHLGGAFLLGGPSSFPYVNLIMQSPTWILASCLDRFSVQLPSANDLTHSSVFGLACPLFACVPAHSLCSQAELRRCRYHANWRRFPGQFLRPFFHW